MARPCLLQISSALNRWYCSRSVSFIGGSNIQASSRWNDENRLEERLQELSRCPMQPIHFAGLAHYSKMIKTILDPISSARFLLKEIPIRVAHVLADINQLPSFLQATSPLKDITKDYKITLKELLELEGQPTEVEQFADAAKTILDRHSTVLQTYREGLVDMKLVCGEEEFDRHRQTIRLHTDRILLNRMSMRLLLSHFCYYFDPDFPGVDGKFELKCDVVEVIKDAAFNAQTLTSQFFANLKSPDVDMKLDTTSLSDGRCMVPYVSSYLFHAINEIYKNSCRSTVERGQELECDLSPVHTKVYEEDDYVVIQVSDMGGGMSESVRKQIFNYNFSTASPNLMKQDVNCEETAPLAGLGFGLNTARLYTRYLGGDLKLTTEEGRGTLVSLFLNRRQTTEVLPMLIVTE